ncbi:hypothetical protein ACJX0J_015828 [Zea mays]
MGSAHDGTICYIQQESWCNNHMANYILCTCHVLKKTTNIKHMIFINNFKTIILWFETMIWCMLTPKNVQSSRQKQQNALQVYTIIGFKCVFSMKVFGNLNNLVGFNNIGFRVRRNKMITYLRFRVCLEPLDWTLLVKLLVSNSTPVSNNLEPLHVILAANNYL